MNITIKYMYINKDGNNRPRKGTYPVSSRISGATYVGVPQTRNIGLFTSVAKPKSASFKDFLLSE